MFMGLQNEQHWLKGHPRSLELDYSHHLIRLTISSKNNAFGFNRIKKNHFFQFLPHLKRIRKQI